MDTRYAYMSSFSIYTNIQKLLVEKFGPIYTTCFELWIVKKLLLKLPQIHNKAMKDGILQHRVEMTHNIRDVKTIGGQIDLISLWGEYNLTDVTELLDEAFIYVHTMKEPANLFHENVKAIKTINNFQKEYESLPDLIQKGKSNCSKEWDFFF